MDLDGIIFEELDSIDSDLADMWCDHSPIVTSAGFENDAETLNNFLRSNLASISLECLEACNNLPRIVRDKENYVNLIKVMILPLIVKEHEIFFSN